MGLHGSTDAIPDITAVISCIAALFPSVSTSGKLCDHRMNSSKDFYSQNGRLVAFGTMRCRVCGDFKCSSACALVNQTG